ncbi:MAG: TolC family protein [Gammaproteobacteria bacterium]|nr:TolC family protein [Gammaproteobacteria bacterium]NNJ83731.1 TolC family protein [Gammaproteobacteria bacterium]
MNKFLVLSFSALMLGGCAVTQTPYTAEEFDKLAQEDMRILPEQEPFDGEMTLDEAMARAIKYNLQRQVKLMEQELAHNQTVLSKFDLLPSLDITGSSTHRDDHLVLDSYDITGGGNNPNNNVNTERSNNAASGKLVWNVLDFGVSHSIAKQTGDEELKSRERKRRAVQEILRDVREAYWRAVGSGSVEDDVAQLSEETLRALRLSAKSQKALLRSPEKALLYQRSLLEILVRLKEIQAGIIAAKAKLTSLMGLRPNAAYTLKKPPAVLPIQRLHLSLEEMEQVALRNHPALREAHYQTRFAAEEARKEIKRLFPGLEFSLGANYDSNRFLHHQSWTSAGVQVSWNLFSLFSASKRIETAKQKKELSNRQRLDLSVALLTRLYVGNAQYELAVEDFQLAACLEDVGAKLHDLKVKSMKAKTGNRLDLIHSRVDLLRLQLQRTVKYADLQASIALLQESTGQDLLPEALPNHDLETLRTAIQERRELNEEELEYVGRYCGQ